MRLLHEYLHPTRSRRPFGRFRTWERWRRDATYFVLRFDPW